MPPPKHLTDRLLEQIQADPADPMPKLVLADWLEEQGEDRLAGAVRWCAEHGRWPEMFDHGPGWKTWHWWRHSLYSVQGLPCPARCAILPADLESVMEWASKHKEGLGRWWSHSWRETLLLLADALKRLEAQCPRP